jgi:DMSO/TMAO reductase YedYZ molybdopterin-dependent catalytic subunit
MPNLTRRRLLGAVAASPLMAQTSEPPLRFAGKRPMLVHNDFPEDLEAPAEYLNTWITPVDAFFVRQHLPRPKINASEYRLEVGGLAAKKLSLTIEDLKKLPQHVVPATLECAGNGRNNFRPRVPGLQWSKGAIGNAEWRGPRVKDIIERAGISSNVKYVHFDGADVGVATTPDFIRSIPLRKAQHDSTILAMEMNGRPLPDLHGFPARLIVPGWDGASWVKWVTKMEAAAESHAGFYMATAYKYPGILTPPGVAPKPETMQVIEGMAVKSFFARPAPGAKFPIGRVTLSGMGWGGENRIARVEVSTDGGAGWADATLGAEDYAFAWRTWRYQWTPATPGHYIVCCRATDSAGRTQPIEPAWNPSGYLWNGIERIGVLVEG